MTVVFVHGVPETAEIWNELRAGLGRESTVLSLPGFGCARPAGFGATMDDYAAWLRAELGALPAPIDLVGHDWGGILTARLATSTDGLLRSWITDTITTVDPEFTWHDFAKLWQTPGEGEAFWDGIRASPADSAALFASLGVPEHHAESVVAAIDETMVGCILDLYRSATDIGHDWEATARSTAPGRVLVGGADPFGDVDRATQVGSRVGADVATLEGAGHWWPLQVPTAGAAALRTFWDEPRALIGSVTA